MKKITPAQARAEIQRRIGNKGLPKADKVRAVGPVTQLGNAELQALAESRTKAPAKKAPAKAAAPKVPHNKGKGAGGPEHTRRRQQAWNLHAEARKAGTKMTLAEAQALMGTRSAAEMRTMTAEQSAALG